MRICDQIPTCFGCDKSGYFGVCDDCKTPDYPPEPINRNVRKPSHNDTNFPDW